MAAALLAGEPEDELEEAAAPWLSLPVLDAGVDPAYDTPEFSALMETAAAATLIDAKLCVPESTPLVDVGDWPGSGGVGREKDSRLCERKSFLDAIAGIAPVAADGGVSGSALEDLMLACWPEVGKQRQQRKFVECEVRVVICLCQRDLAPTSCAARSCCERREPPLDFWYG
jgi:hypothetical protein